jgi:hypothetical protein
LEKLEDKTVMLTARIRPSRLEKLKLIAALETRSVSDTLELLIDRATVSVTLAVPPGKTRVEPYGNGQQTAAPVPNEPPLRGLNGVAIVLRDAPSRGWTAREIVEAMIGRGWQTQGLTPDATISAAIYKDIQQHGSRSRFHKVSKGHFALRA